MKKMKKLFAMLIALTMVLGMSVTAFADEKATITINNAGNGKFSYVQVIEADQTKDTGWDFVDGYAQYFTARMRLTQMIHRKSLKVSSMLRILRQQKVKNC